MPTKPVCDDDLHSEMLRLFIIGCVLSLFIVLKLFRSSRKGPTHVGLQLTYLGVFWMNHWAVPVIYLLPWYCGEQPTFTLLGVRQSLYGLIGYTAGLTVIPILFKLRARALPSITGVPANLRYSMLSIGLFFQIVLARVSFIPGFQWVVGAGRSLAVVAVILGIWNAVCKRDQRSALKWMLAGVIFPISSVMTVGFLNYGIIMMLSVVIFWLAQQKNLFRLVIFGALGSYLLVSVYVTYMRDRNDIRQTIWRKKNTDAFQRVTKIIGTFSNFELFSLYNDSHLEAVDGRLNQNWLVGAAVVHSESTQEWAAGETLIDAALGFIPRILWPDKPAAGSGDLVSKYTGIDFDSSTSVGIGQVMEFYVNFGPPLVFIGFFVWGGVLAWLDNRCVRCLNTGDIEKFTTLLLIGLPMLNLGGSLLEVVAGVAGGVVMANICNKAVIAQAKRRWHRRKPVPVQV